MLERIFTISGLTYIKSDLSNSCIKTLTENTKSPLSPTRYGTKQIF